MTEPSETPAGQPVSGRAHAPSETGPPEPTPTVVTPTPPIPPPAASTAGAGRAALPSDRPEVAVGAVFAGGFLLAMILKRLAR